MCGLFGNVGKNSLIETIKGLKKLEYRGYDSCGIAFFNKKYVIKKKIGDVSKLNKYKFKSEISIGHTRWATHGSINKKNCHPHSSKNFILCHNGIIDNYIELRNKYNIKTIGQTDSEVIVHLLECLYENDTLEAIYRLSKLLKGTYSFLIINKREKRIYFLKKISPLYIALSNNNVYITSDISSLCIKKCYKVLDDTIGYIDYQNYFIYKGDISFDNNNLDLLIKPKRNKHYMLDEIEDINLYINNVLNMKINDDIKELLLKSDSINFIACGSSYNATLFIKYILDNKNICSNCYIASEVINSNIYISKNPLFIYVSQSGETIDVYNVMKKYSNYKSIALTNKKSSLIAKEANYNIYLNSGPELSVAATKTYILEVLTLYYLFTEDKYSISKLKEYLCKIDKIELGNYAKKLKNEKNIFILGSQLEYASCLEVGLKMREVAYINAIMIPIGEIKHGSLALIKKGVYYILLDMYDRYNSSNKEIISRGGKGIIFNKMYINNPLNALIEVIQLDLITYYIALNNKYSIDKPRNLAKSVTVS